MSDSRLPRFPIPAALHSEYEDRPFRHCTRCGESLADVPGGHQVFKRRQAGETTYEYALCHPCHDGLVRRFSVESRSRLEVFYREHVRLDAGLRACAVCGCGRDASADWSLTGLCEGEWLRHAMAVCGGCLEVMQGLISVETRRVWEEFVNDNLPGIPADRLSPSDLLPV